MGLAVASAVALELVPEVELEVPPEVLEVPPEVPRLVPEERVAHCLGRIGWPEVVGVVLEAEDVSVSFQNGSDSKRIGRDGSAIRGKRRRKLGRL